jgi:hypothetical protein
MGTHIETRSKCSGWTPVSRTPSSIMLTLQNLVMGAGDEGGVGGGVAVVVAGEVAVVAVDEGLWVAVAAPPLQVGVAALHMRVGAAAPPLQVDVAVPSLRVDVVGEVVALLLPPLPILPNRRDMALPYQLWMGLICAPAKEAIAAKPATATKMTAIAAVKAAAATAAKVAAVIAPATTDPSAIHAHLAHERMTMGWRWKKKLDPGTFISSHWSLRWRESGPYFMGCPWAFWVWLGLPCPAAPCLAGGHPRSGLTAVRGVAACRAGILRASHYPLGCPMPYASGYSSEIFRFHVTNLALQICIRYMCLPTLVIFHFR